MLKKGVKLLKIFRMRPRTWFKNKYKLNVCVSKEFLLGEELEKIILWVQRNYLLEVDFLLNKASQHSGFTIGEIAMLREGAESVINLLKVIIEDEKKKDTKKRIYED